MRKLLLVAAILCSSNILSTHGDKKKKDDDCNSAYVPASMACLQMASGGETGLCKRSYFVFLTQLCNFHCNVDGQLEQENCHVCNDNEKLYPDCFDLICVEGDQEGSDVPSAGNTQTHSQPEGEKTPDAERTIGNVVQADDDDNEGVEEVDSNI